MYKLYIHYIQPDSHTGNRYNKNILMLKDYYL